VAGFEAPIDKTLSPCRLLFLDGFDEVAVGTPVGGVLAQQFVVFGDLLRQELLLVFPR
jgi:hypothetical protein